jgi:hypothetical protein
MRLWVVCLSHIRVNPDTGDMTEVTEMTEPGRQLGGDFALASPWEITSWLKDTVSDTTLFAATQEAQPCPEGCSGVTTAPVPLRAPASLLTSVAC